MDVPETVRDAAAGAAEGLRKGAKRGALHVVEEIAELAAFTTGGAAYSLWQKHQELKKTKEHVNALHAEGKHEEAANALEIALCKFTLSDEAAAFKVLPRAVKHFNQPGDTAKADQLLDTFVKLDETGLHRFREILLRIGDEDAQFVKLVEWGEATPEQREKMIKIAQVELLPEQQTGHVFATELRRVAIGQRDKSNAHVEEIKNRIRTKRMRPAARP